MHFNIGAVLRGVGAIMGKVSPAIGAVEAMAARYKNLGSKDKQNSVIDIVKAALAGAEAIAGADLLDDAEVEAATRAVVDATVHLHNVVARKHAAAGV